RGERPPIDLAGSVAILVDDGLATGATARAAIAAARSLHPTRIVLAVPVAPADTVRVLTTPDDEDDRPDEGVCPLTPSTFEAVGYWYEDYSPTADAEVRACVATHN